MSIHKIIWATDGSKDSLKALELAESIASEYNASLTGLSVIPLYYTVVNNFPPEEKDKFLEWMDNTLASKKRESMEGIKKEFQNKGIKFDFEVLKGIPHEEIINYAEKENADLITMGRGRILERFVLGGTALKVIRGTRRPILTAAEGKTGGGFKKILAPVAVLHGLSGNFDYALQMAGAYGGKVHVLNVVELGNLKVPNRSQLPGRLIAGITRPVRAQLERELPLLRAPCENVYGAIGI